MVVKLESVRWDAVVMQHRNSAYILSYPTSHFLGHCALECLMRSFLQSNRGGYGCQETDEPSTVGPEVLRLSPMFHMQGLCADSCLTGLKETLPPLSCSWCLVSCILLCVTPPGLALSPINHFPNISFKTILKHFKWIFVRIFMLFMSIL